MNKALIAGLGIALGMAATAQSASAATLVEYNFNEASGQALNSGTATGTNGTFNGSSQRTAVGGPFGSVLDTHGGANGNDLSASSANIQNLQQFTLITWFNPQSAVATSDRLISMFTSTGGGFDWFFQTATTTGNTTSATMRLYTDGANPSGDSGTLTLANNTWYFLAVTYDGSKSSNNVTYYVGTESGAVAQSGSTATLNTNAINTTSADLLVGGTQRTASDRTPNAYFDNVRIDDTVLSQSQLEAIRAANVAAIPEPAGLALLGVGVMATIGRRRRA